MACLVGRPHPLPPACLARPPPQEPLLPLRQLMRLSPWLDPSSHSKLALAITGNHSTKGGVPSPDRGCR